MLLRTVTPDIAGVVRTGNGVAGSIWLRHKSGVMMTSNYRVRVTVLG